MVGSTWHDACTVATTFQRKCKGSRQDPQHSLSLSDLHFPSPKCPARPSSSSSAPRGRRPASSPSATRTSSGRRTKRRRPSSSTWPCRPSPVSASDPDRRSSTSASLSGRSPTDLCPYAGQQYADGMPFLRLAIGTDPNAAHVFGFATEADRDAVAACLAPVRCDVRALRISPALSTNVPNAFAFAAAGGECTPGPMTREMNWPKEEGLMGRCFDVERI